MSKGIKIDFGTSSGYTYDVYTSSSRTSWSNVPYISGFTGQYLTITGTPITGDVLYVKTTCPHCKDQIVKVKLVPDAITLTGSTVNGTCENCGDPGEPECNGAITLYVCGGVRPFTYQWSGLTKSGKVLNATTKDLGTLEESTGYTVTVTDAYGLTATKTFALDVAPCNPPTGLSAIAPLAATPTPTPTPTPAPATYTPTPTNTNTPTPTPTETSSTPSGFYYSSIFGTYPVTSPGNAQLRINNYTSDPKYIYLYGNSTYVTSGTLSGYATMDPGGVNQKSTSINVTITGTNQISYGTYESYLYIPAMTYYNFNIVHTSPAAGSFLFQYTDSTHLTKINVPIQP
jgi:hypothetical protein